MGSGNILAHLGNQKGTEHSYASIIQAIELQKAHLNNIGASINGIIEKSEQRALERQRLQNENNANIQKAYAEKETMSYLQKLESAQKDEKGNALPQEQERINKELAQERAAFFKENGYANTTHRGIIGQIIEGFSTQDSTQNKNIQENTAQNQDSTQSQEQKPQEQNTAQQPQKQSQEQNTAQNQNNIIKPTEEQDNTTAITGKEVKGSKL